MRLIVAGLLLLAAITGAQAQQADVLDKKLNVNVDAQAVSTAVIELAKQAGVQLAMAGVSLDQFNTAGVHGQMSLREALTKMLEGTGFEFRQTGATTITISARSAAVPAGGLGNTDAAPETAQVLETIPVKPVETKPDAGDDSDIPTVIVTATKRAKSQRDIPGSVGVVSGEVLERIGAKELADYIKLVPGVVMNQSSADRSVIVIRGIATSLIPGTTQGTTGIYIDEMPFADLFLPLSTPDLNPFDLERVEILKGPQGTLFGSGAFSGAVRYITQKPDTDEWQAKAALSGNAISGSEGNGYQAAGMLNVPLFGDSAGLRGVFLTRREAGYTDDLNRGEKDVNRLQQETGRLLASWNPLDQLNLSALYFTQKTHQDDFAYADQRETLTRETSNRASPRDSSLEGANLTAEYDFGWSSLQSVSNLVGKKSFLIQDGDRAVGEGTGNTPRPTGSTGTDGPGLEDQDAIAVTTIAEAKNRGWTQEFRLLSPDDSGPWEWLAGAAYLVYRQDSVVALLTPFLNQTLDTLPANPDTLGIFPLVTPLGNLTSLRTNLQALYVEIHSVGNEKSLFGEVTRKLGERWELTFGGRYYKTSLVADVLYTGLVVQATLFRTEERGQRPFSEEGFNPKASIRFQWNKNIQAYVLAAKGFQFGGVQIDPPNLATESLDSGGMQEDNSTYKSSTLWNYEFGVRTEWFNRRLRLDVTAFSMDWKDLQVSVLGTAGLIGYIDNVGQAHSKGVEAALDLNPWRGVNFTSSAAWIEASTDVELVTNVGTAPAGSRLPGSPRFQIANTVSLSRPFDFIGKWSPGLNLTHTHTGNTTNDIFGSALLDGYDLFDARISLLKADSRFEPSLSFSINNIMDTRAAAAILKAQTVRYEDVFFVRPRTLLMSLSLKF